MTNEEITAAAEAFMSHPGFNKLDLLYREGMTEGFKDGARWAQEQFEKLLQQVEALQAEVEKLKIPIKPSNIDDWNKMHDPVNFD
jgi:flagellar biosynthesis/type III secretory pathway protein FliH